MKNYLLKDRYSIAIIATISIVVLTTILVICLSRKGFRLGLLLLPLIISPIPIIAVAFFPARLHKIQNNNLQIKPKGDYTNLITTTNENISKFEGATVDVRNYNKFTDGVDMYFDPTDNIFKPMGFGSKLFQALVG